MKAKVLFVDDESNVLKALYRQFRKMYDVRTAVGGAEALETIKQDGPFSVIITDMQMPGMNGVEFLQNAQKLAPDSVRLMLTGNADQKTAVDAVNKGNVFSFYTKPASAEIMTNAIARGVKQYELVTAERELLDGTLNGSVKLLMEMLHMMAPEIFGKTVAIQEVVGKLAPKIELEDSWNLELAAMLVNIACITLPAETLSKLGAGEQLSQQENAMMQRLPEVGKNLVANIPRLEKVASIIYYQNKYYNGDGFPQDDVSADSIPVESRILKIVQDYIELKNQCGDSAEALKSMSRTTGIQYDPALLEQAAAALLDESGDNELCAPFETNLLGLRPGHVLAADLHTVDGKLIFSAGHKITESNLERLLNYDRISKIREPVQVLASGVGNRQVPMSAAS